ncbi:MAG: hypothetical protein FWD88_04185 [Treponema sp.]|nr:hypothetical protein [Treponema sp.]
MDNAGFEDTVFLLTIRIRMVRDTMRLNPLAELFMERCLDDIAFIDHVLAVLAQHVTDELEQDDAGSANSVFDYASDTEWQFSQLLTEFLLESNAFSAQASPQTRDKILELRNVSNARRKIFENFGTSSQADLVEPVVSSAELSILFGGN